MRLPLRSLWELCYRVDQRVIDRAVDLSGVAGLVASRWKERFDRHVVDGAVNGLGRVTAWCGRQGRKIQTGYVQQYLFMAAAGTVGLIWIVFGGAAR